MKKQFKLLLFVMLVLTLVVMTMICVSAAEPADGDTEATEGFDVANYNFKVVDKDGATVGYYINLGSAAKGTEGGAWTAVPDGGKLLLLKSYSYGANTQLFGYSSKSFTFDGQGFKIEYLSFEMYSNLADGANAVTNTISIYNLTIDAKGKCPFVIGQGSGAAVNGTTYNFEKVTLRSTASYNIAIRGKQTKVNLLGTENDFSAGSQMISIEGSTNITINGGNYTNTAGTQNLIHANTSISDEIVPGFNIVVTINGGTLERGIGPEDKRGNCTAFKGAVFSLYKNAIKGQINVNGGELIGYGAVIFSGSNNLLEVNITGGTFRNLDTGTKNASGVIAYNNNNTQAPVATDKDGKSFTSSVNITGGTFENRNAGMPFFCIRTYVPDENVPFNVTIKNITVVDTDSIARFIGLNPNASLTTYYNLHVENVAVNVDKSAPTNNFIDIENGVMLTATIKNCQVSTLGYMFQQRKDTAAVATVTIDGGSYEIEKSLLTGTAATTVTCTIKGGTIATGATLTEHAGNCSLSINGGDFTIGVFEGFNPANPSLANADSVEITTYVHKLVAGDSLEFDNLPDLYEEIWMNSEYAETDYEIGGFAFVVAEGAELVLDLSEMGFVSVAKVPFVTIEDGTVILKNLVVQGLSDLISVKATSATVIELDNVMAMVSGNIINRSVDAELTLNVKASMLLSVGGGKMVVPTTPAEGDPAAVTVNLTAPFIFGSTATTTVYGDITLSKYSPSVRWAGAPLYFYQLSTVETEIATDRKGAEIHMGTGGLRFTTALSADIIDLIKAAPAGAEIKYGTVIAPADYVFMAGDFTKEALDEMFDSTNGVVEDMLVYVDVPAINTLRDTDEDGIFDTFSAALINIKEANYNRAFAAVAYVTINGTTYYSAYNTVDNARSIAQIATELIDAGTYATDVEALALLNKYAGIVAQ